MLPEKIKTIFGTENKIKSQASGSLLTADIFTGQVKQRPHGVCIRKTAWR